MYLLNKDITFRTLNIDNQYHICILFAEIAKQNLRVNQIHENKCKKFIPVFGT